MFQVPLVTSSTSISREKFWNTVTLYHNRPHLVNRTLAAVSQVLFCQIRFASYRTNVNDLLNRSAILYEIRKLPNVATENITLDFVKNLVRPYDKTVDLIDVSLEDFTNACTGVYISVRILYPRPKQCQKHVEVVTLNKDNDTAIFLSVSDQEKLHIAPPFPYEVQLTASSNTLRINVSFEDADTSHAAWIADKLFTKLMKWVENIDENKRGVQSLSLIKVDEYCLTYNKLKEKYGKQLVKDWPKKSGTDPQKYVFEDIAIASYLICLWKKHIDITFVDCGCGNGLLVFLLNQEGYQGFGLDIRRRPIWDIYPKDTKLEVGAVTPTSLFPDCTWIIGNHSDELTPWIPIIALKSSPKTNFFVLPCCPYDFSGKKFIRTNTSVSAYSDYLSYIHGICEKCGFETNIDKLRIPSTRRTCLVGIQNITVDESFDYILTKVEKMVKKKTSLNKFVQRTNIEKVRNCTQLDRVFVSYLIELCVGRLLSTDNYIKKPKTEDKWNRGKALPLPDLAKGIPKDDLKKLKHECGGLQTLLRNHRYLFEITDGEVRLRLPVSLADSSKYKEKPCWFIKNHPDGCLYYAESCGYSHE